MPASTNCTWVCGSYFRATDHKPIVSGLVGGGGNSGRRPFPSFERINSPVSTMNDGNKTRALIGPISEPRRNKSWCVAGMEWFKRPRGGGSNCGHAINQASKWFWSQCVGITPIAIDCLTSRKRQHKFEQQLCNIVRKLKYVGYVFLPKLNIRFDKLSHCVVAFVMLQVRGKISAFFRWLISAKLCKLSQNSLSFFE